MIDDLSSEGDVTWASGYAEPGYTSGDLGVVFANWNNEGKWDKSLDKWVATDDRPGRIHDILERAGYSTEWSDEWTNCSDCDCAVRTSPDSYGWTPSFVEISGDCVCEDCALKDPETLLEEFINHPHKALTLDIDLPSLGWSKVNGDAFERGLHEGQSDDPSAIAQILLGAGIDHIFKIDDVGQFDVRFSIYARTEDLGKAGGILRAVIWAGKTKSDRSPADILKEALQNIPPAPPGDGVAYTKIDPDTGEIRTFRVSHEDFIEGRMPT